MSPRPPVSRGDDHSKVTQVSFTVVMGFSGADGGPEGGQRSTIVYMLLHVIEKIIYLEITSDEEFKGSLWVFPGFSPSSSLNAELRCSSVYISTC